VRSKEIRECPTTRCTGIERLCSQKRFLVDTSIRVLIRHHESRTLNPTAQSRIFRTSTLVHALNKRVDLVLAVAEVTAFDKMQKFS